jgi:hypothetical protein
VMFSIVQTHFILKKQVVTLVKVDFFKLIFLWFLSVPCRFNILQNYLGTLLFQ